MPHRYVARVVRRIRLLGVLNILSYLALCLAGVAAILSPPTSIREMTETVTLVLWTAILMAGGVFGIISVFTGMRGWELASSLLSAIAIAAYGVTLLVRQWSIPGLASNGTVVAWLMISFSLTFFGRYLYLRREARRSNL